MKEISYRIDQLEKALVYNNIKRIAIYGSANNATALLQTIQSVEICFVIDEKRKGEKFFGKSIMGLECLKKSDVKDVVIAAEPYSAKIVYNRIIKKCGTLGLRIWSIYGKSEDLILSKKNAPCAKVFDKIFQDSRLSNEDIKICVEVEELIAKSSYIDIRQLYKSLETYFKIPGFAEERYKIEINIKPHEKNSIDRIYSALTREYNLPPKYLEEVKQYELALYKESLHLNYEYIQAIIELLSLGISVYFVTYSTYSPVFDELLRELFDERIELNLIFANHSTNNVFSGLLRDVLGTDNTVIYIGSSHSMGADLVLNYDYTVFFADLEGIRWKPYRSKINQQNESNDIYRFPIVKSAEVTVIIRFNKDIDLLFESIKSLYMSTVNVLYKVLICNIDRKTQEIIDGKLEGLILLESSCLCEVLRYVDSKYFVYICGESGFKFNWLLPLLSLIKRNSGVSTVIPYCEMDFHNSTKDKSNECFERCYEDSFVKTVNKVETYCFLMELDGRDKLVWKNDVPTFYVTGRIIYQPGSRIILKNNNTEPILIEYVDSQSINTKKTLLFISTTIPAWDRDAGSNTILSYIKLFIKKGFNIIFLPIDLKRIQPYCGVLQQMGIEVVYGNSIRIEEWIDLNAKRIDYAFVNYPQVAYRVLDTLKRNNISTIYYGHDLHYLRLEREYLLSGEKYSLIESQRLKKIEGDVFLKSDVIYYPSEFETNIVKREFKKKQVRNIPAYLYDKQNQMFSYNPQKRDGLLFVGGGHLPNKDAIEWLTNEIFPRVLKMKKMSLHVVGPYAGNINCNNVYYHGRIDDDELVELYKKTRIIVAPLRYGAGVKGKVINAMYYELPIITTNIGAEGIMNSKDIFCIANETEEFVQRIISLYDDYEKLIQMSLSYLPILKNHFSFDSAWEIIRADFE